MNCLSLPWRSKWGTISVSKKSKHQFTVKILGESQLKAGVKLAVKAVDTSPFKAFNSAEGSYLEQGGNFELIRHDSIDFHEKLGYVLILQADGGWQYVPLTDNRVGNEHLPVTDHSRARYIAKLILNLHKPTNLACAESVIKAVIKDNPQIEPAITPPEIFKLLHSTIGGLLNIEL